MYEERMKKKKGAPIIWSMRQHFSYDYLKFPLTVKNVK
jgi:hypothetical protein